MSENNRVMAHILIDCDHLPCSPFRVKRRMSTSCLVLEIQILDYYSGKVTEYKSTRNTDFSLLHGSSSVIGDQLYSFLNLHVWQWIRLIWYPTKARNIDNVPVFYPELIIWEHFHVFLKALTPSPDITPGLSKVHHTVTRDRIQSFHWKRSFWFPCTEANIVHKVMILCRFHNWEQMIFVLKAAMAFPV